MDKKSVIAIVLITIAWVGYFVLTRQEYGAKKPSEQVRQEVPARNEKPEKPEGPAPQPETRVTAMGSAGGEHDIVVKTKKFLFTLSNKGASIKGALYRPRNIELTVKENPYHAKGAFDFSLFFNADEFLHGTSLEGVFWNYRKEGDNRVIFSTEARINGSPVRIEKAFTFPDEGYGFHVEYRLINTGWRDLVLNDGSVIVSPGEMLGPALDFSNSYNRLSGIYSLNGDFKQSSKGGGGFLGCGSSSSSGPYKKETGTINWAGIMSRYFLIIMIPEHFTGVAAIEDNRKDSGFRTGIYVPMKKLAPGRNVTKSFLVYLGEKNKQHLASVDKQIVDAADVNKIIEPIRNFVIWCLLSINKLIGNLGWSLVIFSLLTKVVFMPLTIKSTESMKKMQQLSPKLNELKAKFKDKPELMQKEMMKLYKENKVNPMGGCFPLLLQMPFFFALYSALINSIDLWNAPFILWMQDLSMPDTVATISGFHLNILPIVMTGTTYLQQKLSTVDTAGQQKVLMMLMPLMFIFIFWNMPSGLVLYWALQNVFQIMHQLFINYRAKAKKA
jgi:YidC/Oxa1 family membrane protein insertase